MQDYRDVQYFHELFVQGLVEVYWSLEKLEHQHLINEFQQQERQRSDHIQRRDDAVEEHGDPED